MIGLQSVSIGVGTPLGTLFMGAIANSSIQWAVSISAVLGLLFMLPALIFTPLVRQPTVPVQPLGSASDDATGPSVT